MVTAFTAAHSNTLALATLSDIHVSGPPVGAMIALSIVFVVSKIVRQQCGCEGLASTQFWLVALTFGLLHGFGFAGALAEVGLPENSILLALRFFNIGVEISQLLFIIAVWAAVRLATRLAGDRLDLAQGAIVSAYEIGTLASYWIIESVSNFWS